MTRLIASLAIAVVLTAHGAGIVVKPGAPANVKLAARKIRRYVYLRAGELLPVAESGQGIALKLDPSLATQQYRLRTADGTLTISGGSDVAAAVNGTALAWPATAPQLNQTVVLIKP
jgi:hypothetical protein